MTQNRSLKDYIKQKFDNKIWAVAETFLNNNTAYIKSLASKLHKPGEVEIADVNIEHVWVEDQKEMKINFDIAVSIIFEIQEGNYRYDDYEEKTVWLLIECTGDLNEQLDDFRVLNHELYSGKNKVKAPLDDSLVPVISTNDLERVSEDFLNKYYPDALKEPTYLDTLKLAEIMGVNLEFTNITADKSVFGRCFFETAESEIYDVEKGEYIKKCFKRGTILVDKESSFLSNLGVMNNTIVHECVHWAIHQKAFALDRLYDNSLSNIGCKVNGGVLGQTRTSVEWMEWQANALAPKIQMPLKQFKVKTEQLISKIRRETSLFDVLDIIQPLIDELANFYGVSRTAAKIRLIEAGYDIASGAFIYLDGHYVEPHTAYNKEFLKKNETFSISTSDAALLKFTSKSFKEKIEKGEYIFVDSHFVLNLPLYVEKDIFGVQKLTHYARKHMEECCLVFELKIKNIQGERYSSECYLNRDKNTTVDFDIVYHDGFENSTPEKQREKLAKVLKEENDVFLSLTQDYCKNLEIVMKWRNLNNKQIAERTMLNHETVGRCISGKTVSINTLILICLALHLPYKISMKIINDSSVSLKNSDTNHLWYDFILQHYYAKDLSEIRKFCTDNNITPL